MLYLFCSVEKSSERQHDGDQTARILAGKARGHGPGEKSTEEELNDIRYSGALVLIGNLLLR